MNGCTRRQPARRPKACLARDAHPLSLPAISMHGLSTDQNYRKMNTPRTPGLRCEATISAATNSLRIALNQAENLACLRRTRDVTAHLARHLRDSFDQIRVARRAQLRIRIISKANRDVPTALQ